MQRPRPTIPARRGAGRSLRRLFTSSRGEGLAEYAVVLGVLALGIAAALVLMRDAGPEPVAPGPSPQALSGSTSATAR
jgi:hypothetical protein